MIDLIQYVCAPSMTAATLSSPAFTLESTLATVSLTLCVAFRTWAVAIRASSCVSLSSLFNAPSIPVLPTNFFKYFSENISVNSDKLVLTGLTCSALLHLLRGNGENREDLD